MVEGTNYELEFWVWCLGIIGACLHPELGLAGMRSPYHIPGRFLGNHSNRNRAEFSSEFNPPHHYSHLLLSSSSPYPLS